MRSPIIRVILLVPDAHQTTPDTWQDTSRFETYDLPCPDELAEAFAKGWRPKIVGAEFRPAKEGGAP